MPASVTPAAPPSEFDSLLPPLAEALQRRGLAAPALLYLVGHRPLAFAAGQLLALAAPLAAVLGLRRTMTWAHLLSTPEGVDSLQAALETCVSDNLPEVSETRRSGNLPDMPANRDKVNRRATSPTYAGYAGGEEHSQ